MATTFNGVIVSSYDTFQPWIYNLYCDFCYPCQLNFRITFLNSKILFSHSFLYKVLHYAISKLFLRYQPKVLPSAGKMFSFS